MTPHERGVPGCERPRTSREVKPAAPTALPSRLLTPLEMAEKACGPGLLEPARRYWIAARVAEYSADRAAILARLDVIAGRRIDVDDGMAADMLDALRAELRGDA